jgi:hypothetical protein
MRDCYLHGRLWKAGEPFNPPFEGAEPNRHFTIGGVPVADERIIRGPGDDPRSTAQILADIQKIKPSVTKGTRKQLFRLWQELTGAVDPVKVSPAAQVPDPHNTGARHDPKKVNVNPTMNKLFSDMGPDDIDSITVKEIREKLAQPPYSLELGTGVITKADLIKRGIQVEEQQKLSIML